MKKRIKLIILLLLPLFSLAGEGFVIKGNITGIISGSVSIVPDPDEPFADLPEKVRIIDGAFTFTGKMDRPKLVKLKISTKVLSVYLENTEYTVNCRFDSLTGSSIRGGKTNDAFHAFMTSGKSHLACLRANPASPLAPWLAQMVSFSKENTIEAYNLLSEEGKRSFEGKELKRKIDIYEKTRPGTAIPDFKMSDPAGKPVSVHDMAGKIMVIDFWASWCAPCIGFIPKLRELHNRYRNNDVSFVSVSVDDNKTKWKEAMDTNKMEWKQALAAGGFSEKEGIRPLFSISSIPYLIVVDKQGKIVASLDGYHKEELEKVLEDLVKK